MNTDQPSRQAVILLGGPGTRLQDRYPDRPKALVPVAGKPFIEWQVDWLRRGGATRIHLAAGYRAEQVEAWADGRNDITVSRETEPLGTAGALKLAEPCIRTDPFLVVNGDTLLPHLDFQRLENHPKKVSNDWKITMIVVEMKRPGRFGTVAFDEDGRVISFREKAQLGTGWINGGVYGMKREILKRIPSDRPCDLESDIFPGLAREGGLYAQPVAPPLFDMGTPEGLEELTQFLGRDPWSSST